MNLIVRMVSTEEKKTDRVRETFRETQSERPNLEPYWRWSIFRCWERPTQPETDTYTHSPTHTHTDTHTHTPTHPLTHTHQHTQKFKQTNTPTQSEIKESTPTKTLAHPHIIYIQTHILNRFVGINPLRLFRTSVLPSFMLSLYYLPTILSPYYFPIISLLSPHYLPSAFIPSWHIVL